MVTYDAMLAGDVGTIDFDKYCNTKALLRTKNWPPALVTQSDIASALADEAKLWTDWRPSHKDLSNAPELFNWHFVDHRARGLGIRLFGRCDTHPVLLGPRHITTSHIVAIDMDKLNWARTLSRFYKLSRFGVPDYVGA